MFASTAFYNFGSVQKLLVPPEILEPKLRESNTNKLQFFNIFLTIAYALEISAYVIF